MLKKIVEKLKSLGGVIWQFAGTVWQKIVAIFKKIKKGLVVFGKSKAAKNLRQVAIVCVVLLALVQFAFAIMIYGLGSEHKATKTVAKFLPFPIAVANHNFITYNEYQKEKDYIHHFYASTQQEGINYADIDTQILNQLIENKVIRFEAFRYGANVNEAEIDEAINNIVIQNGGQDKVVQVLQDLYGLTLKEFRKLVEMQMIREKFNDEVITRVTARHILIQAANTVTAEQIEAARVKAQGILDEIRGGLDFAEAAKKYSEDSASAGEGGILEPFARGDMVDPFSDVAFVLQPGEISELVQTDFGWHIIKVESKSGKIDQSFTEWLEGTMTRSLVWKFYKVV